MTERRKIQTRWMHRSARDFLTVLLRGWPLILGFTVVCGMAGLAYSFHLKPIYEATSTLFVASGSSSLPSAYDSAKASQERVGTYAQLIYSDAVLSPALEGARLDKTVSDTRPAIHVTADPQVSLLEVSARDQDPEVAQRLANAVSDSLASAVSRLEIHALGAEPTARLTVVSTAEVQPAPVVPNTTLNVALGCVVGFVLGLLSVIVRERFNNTVRDSRDVETALGRPVVAEIPAAAKAASREVDFAMGSDGVSVAYRDLRSLLLSSRVAPIKTLLCTATLTNEDAATVARNLANVMHRAKIAVVWVSVNFSADEPSPGLADVVLGRSSLAEVRQRDNSGMVTIGPGRSDGTVPADLVAMPEFREVLDQLGTSYDLVIVDASGILDGGGAATVASNVDGVLLVTRVGRTKLTDLASSRENLANLQANVIGAVLCARSGSRTDERQVDKTLARKPPRTNGESAGAPLETVEVVRTHGGPRTV